MGNPLLFTISFVLRLFANKLAVDVGIEGVFIHVADGQIGVGVHDDTILVYLLYLSQVDDIRAVDTHETACGQPFLHFLHREEHDERLGPVFQIDAQILAHALHIADVANVDAYHLVLGFQKECIVFVDARHGGRIAQLILRLHLVGGALEVVESEGFQQVVDGVDLKALNGILAVGGGENYQWR